ncbi:Gfo/Idh/MocA family protein [Blastococcus deserti]
MGCVGTGFIAGRHLAALASFPDVDVVAVADAVPDRADAAAARFGARGYHDGVALLESEELDAVWLCVPPFAHGPLEQAAVDRSLPFFVEKPLAHDLATAVGIAESVRARGLPTAVGYHWRHLGVVREAERVLAGSPAQLLLGYWLDATPAAPWWSDRARSGGQVLEQTTHIFDLARVLVGEVDVVHSAEAGARAGAPGRDVPVAATTVLRFSSGAVGSISCTRLLGRRHRVGVQLLADGIAVELGERSLTDHDLRVAGGDGERVVTSGQDPVADEDREFLDVLRGLVPRARVPYAEAVRTHALAWAADRSARDGEPVCMPLGGNDD